MKIFAAKFAIADSDGKAGVAAALGLDADQRKPFAEIIRNLYRLFLDKDCSLLEINPLAIVRETGAYLDYVVFRRPGVQAVL